MRARPIITCARCGRRCPHDARGLGTCCYGTVREHGVLDAYPRRSRPLAYTIEDYRELRAQGYTRRQIAERLGVTRSAIEQAVIRARRKGWQVPA